MLDDIEAPRADIQRLLAVGTGHIILTSRNPNWLRHGNVLEIGCLQQAEAVEFLTRRTGQMSDQVGSAETLANQLGNLPLALEQAGAYIESTSIGFGDYVRLFNTHRLDLLERGGKPLNYDHTVATTWRIAYKRLKSARGRALELLYIIAHLNSEPLPKVTLAKFLDELVVNEALKELRSFSMIRVTQLHVTVHKLVQEVTRSNRDCTVKHLNLAIKILDKSFPTQCDVPSTWPSCWELVSHVDAVSTHCNSPKTDYYRAVRLVASAATYAHYRGLYDLSETRFKRAFELLAALTNKEEKIDVVLWANLANSGAMNFRAVGKFVEARGLLMNAIRLLSLNKAAVKETAIVLNSLALVEADLGNEERSQELLQFSYSTAPDELRIASLAISLHRSGEPLRALQMATSVKTDIEAKLGSSHPLTLSFKMSMCHMLMDAAQYEQAYALATDLLHDAQTQLGDDHPHLPRFLTLAGIAARHFPERGDEALRLLEEAMLLSETKTPAAHPSRIEFASNLAEAYQAAGRNADALALYEKAEQLAMQVDNPHYRGLILNNFAAYYKEIKDFSRAEAKFLAALEFAAHPLERAKTLCSLGQMYGQEGKRVEASTVFAEAEGIAKAVQGPSVDAGEILVFVGRHQRGLGEINKCHELLSKGLEHLEYFRPNDAGLVSLRSEINAIPTRAE